MLAVSFPKQRCAHEEPAHRIESGGRRVYDALVAKHGPDGRTAAQHHFFCVHQGLCAVCDASFAPSMESSVRNDLVSEWNLAMKRTLAEG